MGYSGPYALWLVVAQARVNSSIAIIRIPGKSSEVQSAHGCVVVLDGRQPACVLRLALHALPAPPFLSRILKLAIVLPRHTPPCGQRIEQRERSALKINRLNHTDVPVEHFLGGWWSIKIYHIPSELYSKKTGSMAAASAVILPVVFLMCRPVHGGRFPLPGYGYYSYGLPIPSDWMLLRIRSRPPASP